jgi:hypothetical protein
MSENPFGDDANVTKVETRPYLILVAASKDNLSMTQAIVQNIKKHVDTKSNPLWIDSKGIGIFVRTELVASVIQERAVAGLKSDLLEAFKELLVLEIGEDWFARKDAPTTQWLAKHIGDARIVPRAQSKRR